MLNKHCASNGYKICWGTKMFDPLDEDKKKKKENTTLDDSLLILAIIIFFLQTWYKWSKGFVSWWLLRKNIIFCILNWGMAVSCSRTMNFVKCRVSETSKGNFFCSIIFLCFLRIFALGPLLLISSSWQNTSPLYSYFLFSDPSPYTAIFFSWPSPWKYPPPPHTPITKWLVP